MGEFLLPLQDLLLDKRIDLGACVILSGEEEDEVLDELVTGVDALLRWNHPQRGLLEAHEFIEPLMEGRLGELAERAVLRMVCQQIKIEGDTLCGW